MTYTTLHRQLKIDQHEPHQLSGVISDAPEGLAVPSAHLTLAGNIISMIFYIKMVCSRQFEKCTKININIHIFFILINKYNNQHTKKESACRYITLLGHVILNHSQPVLVLFSWWCMLSAEATTINVLVLSLTRPGSNPRFTEFLANKLTIRCVPILSPQQYLFYKN
jgi:hypothetical protein